MLNILVQQLLVVLKTRKLNLEETLPTIIITSQMTIMTTVITMGMV